MCSTVSGAIVTFLDDLSRPITTGDNPPAPMLGIWRVERGGVRYMIDTGKVATAIFSAASAIEIQCSRTASELTRVRSAEE